jgi:hypothetical protein
VEQVEADRENRSGGFFGKAVKDHLERQAGNLRFNSNNESSEGVL